MPNPDADTGSITFRSLKLSDPLIQVLDDIGYETPTPIQRQAIPALLAGRDLLGHAPTGTGKTAAFALPLLSKLDLRVQGVQILTLTPTRELAIQVAEAYQHYASKMAGFHVLPIYGGQEYGSQIRQLKRGVHVVVGTPGRLMDHMRKGTLQLNSLKAVVLDEADEMLRMGFIEEVTWILEQTPAARQTALFSATMPKQVEHIARRHLKDPAEISIKAKTATAETIRQRYWQVSGVHKLDALTRMLEVEPFDAILMFVRTKTATSELAEKLEARGYAAAAMNGDMPQAQREQTVDRLKRGVLDILVATDVAARGLDVDRISHVINYDIPYDTEAYIHRIGRTGRAGRSGEAILFVAPRERRMLAAIEKATRQKVEQMYLPSTETVNNKRIKDFKQKITDTLAGGETAFMQSLVEQYRQEHDVPAIEIAAGLAKMFIGDKAMLLDADKGKPLKKRDGRENDKRSSDDRGKREHTQRPQRDAEPGTERFRIEVGHVHGVKPGNIVGAIANEAGLAGEHIGHIQIEEDYSLVDLPEGMPKEIFKDLQNVRVCGRQIRLSRPGESQTHTGGADTHQATSKNRDRPAGKSKGKPKGKSKGKPFGKPTSGTKGKAPGKPASRVKSKPAPAGKGKPASRKKKPPKKRLKKPAD